VSRYNSECRPSLSADGTRLVFEATASNGPAYDPENQLEEGFYPYQADWDGSAWTNIRGLDRDLFEGHSFPRLSPGGEWLFTTSAGEIYRAHRAGESWTTPLALGGAINALGPDGVNGASCTSRDAAEIYFASERRGGMGGFDIWVCRLQGSFTDSLTNLGPGINTEGSEVRPAISPDGRYLLFSDFVGGRSSLDYGATDLYISEWVSGSWSTAEPLPAPINNHRPACTAHWASDTELLIGGEVSEGGGGAEDVWVTALRGTAAGGLPSLVPGNDAAAARAWRGRGPAARAQGGAPAIRPPGRWTLLANLSGASIVEDLLETSAGMLLAATSDSGAVFRSEDGGETWVPRSPGALADRIYCLEELADGTVLAGTYPSGRVFESGNQGWSWSPLAPLPTWVTAVRAIEELDSGDLLVGVAPETLGIGFNYRDGRIFRSTDRGQSWAESSGLTSIYGAVHTIHESADGTLWAGGRAYGGNIHRSLNGGLDWEVLTPAFQAHVSVGSAAHFLRDSRGTFWGMGWGHGDTGAFLMRHQGGDDWEVESPFERDGEYRDGYVFDMVEDQRGWLYAGTQPSGGSPGWISTDGGQVWHPTTPLEGARELLALLATQDGRVLGGTSGDGGVWEWRRSLERARR